MQLRAPILVLALTLVVSASAVAEVAEVATHRHGRVETFSGVAHSADQAAQRARAMLDRTYLLGAVRVGPPSGYQADHPHAYEVQDERWLAVSGTPLEVTRRLSDHPPTGFAGTAAGITTGSASLELTPVGQQRSLLHLLDISARGAGQGRVLVLVQATVAWVPPRTAAETIGANVHTGTLTSGFGDGPDQARTLTAAEVRALAATLNARPTTSPYTENTCPEGNLGLAILTVPFRNADAVFQIDIGTCGQVQVQVDGETQPNLVGGAALSEQIDDLLSATSAGT